jgi:hypothetical protein
MKIRYAKPVSRKKILRCPNCLFRFRAGECLARCERGCLSGEPGVDISFDKPLLFDPRAFSGSAAPRLPFTTRMLISADCPRCLKPTACWVCPACRADLPSEGFDEPLSSIVLLGARHSGKTTLASVALHELETRLGPLAGIAVDPWGPETRAVVERLNRQLYLAQPGTSMVDSELPMPLLYRLHRGQGKQVKHRWLSVFDVPGAPWEDRDASFLNSAIFVTSADALVLTLDPTHFGPVEAELRKRGSARSRAQRERPQDAYSWRRVSALEEIRHLSAFFGQRGLSLPAPTRLAIAVTKFDIWGELAPAGGLLRYLSASDPPEQLSTHDLEQTLHDELEALLVEWSGETLVQQLDLKFSKTRCFAVSSLGDAADAPANRAVPPRPFGVDGLLRWILQAQDVPIPLALYAAGDHPA